MHDQNPDTTPPIDETTRQPKRLPRKLDFLYHYDRSDNPFVDALEGYPITDSEGRES